MPLNYINVREEDFSGGEDARSAENQIPQGYVRQGLNVDVVEKRLRKRPGYQGFAGNFPVRVVSTEYNSAAQEMCFTLDRAVDLSAAINLSVVQSTPLVIYGKNSAASTGTGPFTAGNTARYYPGFYQKLRKQFLSGTNTLVIPGTEHGLGSDQIFVEIVQSLSTSTLENQQIDYTKITIDSTSFDITIDYTNGGPATDVFVYYALKVASPNQVYKSATTTVPSTGLPVALPIITAGMHGLSNFNIVARVFVDNGPDVEMVRPESLILDSANGQVTVTVVNGTGSSRDYYVILSAAPAGNIRTGNIANNTTATISILSPDTAFIFPSVYLDPGNTLTESVIPDSISYDAINNVINLSFTNNTGSAKLFRVYWEYGAVQSTELCVADTDVTVSGEDDRPQLTIWGLDHTEIYGLNRDLRKGWANHIDSYRRPGEARVIAGLGGNLFSVQEYTEAASTYLYGSALTSLFARSQGVVLAPVFWETGENPGRSRGYITGTALGDNWATCNSITWDSGVSAAKYSLTIPDLAMFTSTGAVETDINNILAIGDFIEVEDAGYSRHNGTYKILQLQVIGNQLDIWVTNPNIDSSIYDDTGVAARVGVFTDRITLQIASPFIVGDTLLSDLFSDNFVISMVSEDAAEATKIYVDGITDVLEIASGLQLVGRRTSSVIPLRLDDGTATVDNFVRGDMVSYTGIPRLLRILSVNASATMPFSSIVGNGTTATGTVADTSSLLIGGKVLIRRAGVYSGEVTITAVPTSTTFEFASDLTDTVGFGNLVGNTIEIDEQLEWEDTTDDSNFITVERRLIPIEAPESTGSAIVDTYIQHFDSEPYSNQPLLRSNVIASGMYLTNSSDEVMKFDGANIYRAGLPNWQPGLLIQVDTAAAAKIVVDARVVPYSAKDASSNRLTVAAGDEFALPVGTSVYLSGDTELHTIRAIDETNHYIYFEKSIPAASASGTITEQVTYRYYYRLNAVDANNNIIASAVSQSQDYVVLLPDDAAVYHKLVGFPTWDNYDYDRLEVEIYRTKASQVAPFYRVITIPLEFDNDNGYVEFTDTFRDESLIDLDVVSTALKGQELGIAWQEPLRGQAVTTAGNSLVLANIKDYPQLDIVLRDSGTTANSNLSDVITRFRRDNTNTSLVTNMVDTACYQWRTNAAAVTVAGITGTLGASFSVNAVAHGFTTPGQWVYLYYPVANAANQSLKYAGWYQVFSVTDANNFVVQYDGADAGAATQFPTRLVFAADRRDIPVLLGTDGNLGQFNGNSTNVIFQGARRLAMAINSTMRNTDITIVGYEDFQPWLIARGGSDTGVAGRLLVRQPRADVVTPEMTMSSYSNFDVYVNDTNLKTKAGVIQERSATTRVYPSRLLASYENYPEIFDNPTSILDTDSESAIDVNPADGQEITTVVPLFGESAFGAAQQSSVVVVLKANSIYLVDLNEKRNGRNPVQRIETGGIGCTAPGSVSSNEKGVFFANESGMYCLKQDMKVYYVGQYEERNWLQGVDRTQLDLVQGHTYTTGRKYKLSVPLIGDTSNTQVFCYDITSEGQKYGAWTRYNNHPSTGWCNLSADAFFSTSTGRIMIIRRVGDNTDYRDDNESVAAAIQTRPSDFGLLGSRKVLDNIVVAYRAQSPAVGTAVGAAIDTETEYQPTNAFRIIGSPASPTGMSDAVSKDVVIIKHNVNRRKGIYHSIQFTNSTIDEPIEVAGIDFETAATGKGRGIKNAGTT